MLKSALNIIYLQKVLHFVVYNDYITNPPDCTFSNNSYIIHSIFYLKWLLRVLEVSKIYSLPFVNQVKVYLKKKTNSEYCGLFGKI